MAGMLAHNNCCGVGRGQDWASHDIEHELSALYDCTHGAGLAVVVPAWMTYNLNHDVMRFAQLASRVWAAPWISPAPEFTARAGIQCLKNFLKSIGMPGTPERTWREGRGHSPHGPSGPAGATAAPEPSAAL